MKKHHSDDESAKIDEICRKFVHFGGGSVDLDMSDSVSGMATLCIRNSNKYNALTGKMMVDLLECVKRLESWQEGRSVLIVGANDVFCAGADFQFATHLPQASDGEQMCHLMQVTLGRLPALHLITACYIQGKAIGGGAELTTAADWILIAPTASVRWVHLNMGLVPAFGGMTRLTKLIGPGKALEMLTSRKEYSAQELVDLGYCNCIQDSIDGAKEWLAKRTLGVSCEVLRATKASLYGATYAPHDAVSLENEKKIFRSLWGGPAHQEAVKTVLKR